MRTRQSSSQPAYSSCNICSNARKSYLRPVLNWAKQKLLLLSPEGPAMIGGLSPGWLQVSHQRGQAHVCIGWKAEGFSCLTHTCLLTAWVNLLLPLLKHKSVKKMWLSQKTSLCCKQASLRYTASPHWMLHVKQPHSPGSQGHRVTQGSCTPSTEGQQQPEPGFAQLWF